MPPGFLSSISLIFLPAVFFIREERVVPTEFRRSPHAAVHCLLIIKTLRQLRSPANAEFSVMGFLFRVFVL